MKCEKENVSKALYRIAKGIKEIADDISNEQYDARKWTALSEIMADVTLCLRFNPLEFSKNSER